MRASKSSASSPLSSAIAAVLLAILCSAAVWLTARAGYTLYYGDAQAHLAIARRIVDSRTPGYDQIGTVWLPLPHWLMLPLVGNDEWWRTGVAGAIPAAACFVLAGMFLFAALRRTFGAAAAFAGLAAFALNPNLLYLAATPMTEAFFFAALAALLYATVWFRQSDSMGAVVLAGAASLAATLIRYEGWFLVPFACAYVLFAAKRRRFLAAFVFGLIASAGPLYWLAHNLWYYGNALEFYNGPYSARAIYERALAQGLDRYPGDHDWAKAWLYFRAAAQLCAGLPLLIAGVLGVFAALVKRSFWPVALLALPPLFYIWSIHSSGTPIFVPALWPNSYYNTRYGTALMPLLAWGVAALAALCPPRWRAPAAAWLALIAISPWAVYLGPENWICWKESQVNSVARREWTREAAAFVRREYRTGAGVFSSLGDLAGIWREAGIPLREILHEGNNPHWQAAVNRPDLFLWEQWVVAIAGDKVATAVLHANRPETRYECVKMIAVKGAPVIEVYRRVAPRPDVAAAPEEGNEENPVHEGARRQE